ncbi:hypothetical protein TWF706_003345 [Orbilia oligospora]|nr:hypothetical protein TWF706_003345 [Orbilia oligospora]
MSDDRLWPLAVEKAFPKPSRTILPRNRVQKIPDETLGPSGICPNLYLYKIIPNMTDVMVGATPNDIRANQPAASPTDHDICIFRCIQAIYLMTTKQS